jgi:hypothetical protein
MTMIPRTIQTLALIFCVAFATPAISQSSLPAVFLMGQNEEAYEKLCQEHARTLLAVSDNDMKKALNNWLEFVKSVQDYAGSIKYDIKGLKVRIHVFWNADGAISNIGYFVMPNSRNFKTEELNAFFGSFIRQYHSNLHSDKKFSHYTSATFPTFVDKKE